MMRIPYDGAMRVLLILCVLGVLPALAQSPENTKTAVPADSVREWTKAFGQGDYETALRLLRAARAAQTDAAIRVRLQWNIARCLEELDRHAEALRIFTDYQKSVDDPVRSSRAQSKIDALNLLVYGAIAVDCIHATALAISVDDVHQADQCPTILRHLKPGSVVVEGRSADGSSARTIVEVVAGKTVSTELVFPVASPTPQVDEGMSSGTMIGIGSGILVVGAIATWLALSTDDTKSIHQARICIDQGCNE